jgi:hypothetical protein
VFRGINLLHSLTAVVLAKLCEGAKMIVVHPKKRRKKGKKKSHGCQEASRARLHHLPTVQIVSILGLVGNVAAPTAPGGVFGGRCDTTDVGC